MSINIESKRFKRVFWYVSEANQYGVSVTYTWENFDEIIASLESKKGFEEVSESYEELIELLDEIEEGDDVSIDMAILEGAPGFGSLLCLTHPNIDQTLSDGFDLELSFSYTFKKAIERQEVKAQNYWCTSSPAFKWNDDWTMPLESQAEFELEVMAKVWRSGCWKSFDDLKEFMGNELEMEIEDETIEFVDRYL